MTVRAIAVPALALAFGLLAVPAGGAGPGSATQLAQARASQLQRHYVAAERLYSKALAQVPASAPALLGRGESRLALGETKAAGDDFRHLTRLEPKDPYARIWLFLARARSGSRDVKDLAGMSRHGTAPDWPQPVIDYLAGSTGWIPMFDAALRASGAARTREICEAELFYAENILSLGRKNAAMAAFAVARGDRCVSEPELKAFAQSEYERLYKVGYRPPAER